MTSFIVSKYINITMYPPVQLLYANKIILLKYSTIFQNALLKSREKIIIIISIKHTQIHIVTL
jgi:hypothetical protein